MAASFRRVALRCSRRLANAGSRCFGEPLQRHLRLIGARPRRAVGTFAGALLLGAIVVGAASPEAPKPAPLLAALDVTPVAAMPAASSPIATAAPAAREKAPPMVASPRTIPSMAPAVNLQPIEPPEPPVAAPPLVVDPAPAAAAAKLAADDPVAAPVELARAAGNEFRAAVAVPEDRPLIAANRLPPEIDQCQGPADPDDQFGTLVHWAPDLNAAARRAKAQHKLVFAIQVSGNFANEEFT